jgi:hypothetical protein
MHFGFMHFLRQDLSENQPKQMVGLDPSSTATGLFPCIRIPGIYKRRV